MSTQSAPSILFTHTAPQQGFRLLELPPEVADLLTSDHPPTFYLKTPTPTTAQPTTSSSSSSRPTDSREYVNLCTPTQTYRIRQVQSSNSLHILRPSGMGGRDTVLRREDLAVVDVRAAAAVAAASQGSNGGRVGSGVKGEGEGDGDMDVDVDVDVDVGVDLAETVTTIAKCGSTLELHVPEGGFRAAEFLGALVGRFAPGMSAAAATGSAREREGEGGAGAAEDGKVMETVFTDIPVSRAECERVWVEGCAFVWRGRAWVPTPEVRMEVWKRMVDGAVVQGIDLRTQFLVDDLWKSVVVEDEDEDGQIPRALFEAIVRRVVEEEEEERKSLLGEKLKWASLDREVCVRWVGETYLEAMAPMASAAVGRSEFLNAWKDHLPEAWREEVALDKLTDAVYQLPDPTTISFVTEFERQRSKKNLPTDASAATAAKKSRNWHELFKNQKRQKR